MQEKFVRDQIKVINAGAIKVAGGVQISDKYKCKVCGKGLIRRPSKKLITSGPAAVIPPVRSLTDIKVVRTITP
jgi:DNA topoisomerase-3